MSITTSQAKALRSRIERLVEAAREDQVKGGGDPDDIEEIEQELRFADRDLDAYITKLTKGPAP